MRPDGERARRVTTALLRGFAAVLGASTLLKAALDVSTAWDVWYYHFPFAARLTGIVPASAYAFHELNEQRYRGFPLLAELLQGSLWRMTGRPEAANFVAFAGLPLYTYLLRRVFGVPMYLSFIALLAVPLVQLHATASYIDLPSNLCASALVMLVFDLWSNERRPSGRWLALFSVLSAAAINMRFQMNPLVGLAWLLALARLLPLFARELATPRRRRAAWAAAALVMALPVVCAIPLKNALLHHNPYYPMRLELAGVVLPHAEPLDTSVPDSVKNAPRQARWLFSVLEVGLVPLSDRRRWTVDQFTADPRVNRMGGYFHAYVVAHVALLGWQVLRRRTRAGSCAGVAFALLTSAAASMPQSHELRYYLYWMIVLVSLNCVLACARGARGPEPVGLAAACCAALVIVVAVTGGIYVYPSGYSFSALLRDRVDPALMQRIGEQDRVCFYRDPWTLLYAAPFHPPRTYAIREGVTDAECFPYRLLASRAGAAAPSARAGGAISVADSSASVRTMEASRSELSHR